MRERVFFLQYGKQGSQQTYSVPTAADGVLDRLRIVSERVADAWGCTRAAATMCVLTGHLPVVSAISGSIRIVSPVSARSRVVLTIDPACPPREVTAAYRTFRATRFKRIRRIQPKAAMLAVFVAKHPSRDWNIRMSEWNRLRPKDAYKSVTAFRRDAEAAVARLTELPLKQGAPAKSRRLSADVLRQIRQLALVE